MISVIKCPKCGGEADLKSIDTEKAVWKCRYCDSINTMPRNLDKVGNLYNMANYYRQSNHFDEAVHIYQEILKEDSSDAEAYFGLAISRYGIEYVEDPEGGIRIPTCHRTKEESILNDPDYLLALEYADATSRDVYQREGEKIDAIMQKILKLSRDEADYDIFISYKENDEREERTSDSVYAQEIYEQLIKRNYKIFFARKSLEKMLGKEYEPIIFSALKSAKIMIVVGTTKENFEAVWVKNEWSRFLELRKTDAGKTIIPCYKDVSPYELPNELSRFQSQDMGKIGFLQDLCDGIEKIMKKGEAENADASGDVERLLKNAETFQRLNDFEKAVKLYENLTNDHPEDYRAWWELAKMYSENFQNCYSCTPEEYSKIKKLMQNSIVLSSGKPKDKFQKELEIYEKNYEVFNHSFDLTQITQEQKENGIRFLLRKGFESLEKGRFEESSEIFEKCLRIDENVCESYWGLLLVKRNCFTEKMLIEQLKCIDGEEYYIKACEKADKGIKKHYCEVAETIRKKCEKRREEIINDFKEKEAQVKSEIERIEKKMREIQGKKEETENEKRRFSDKQNKKVVGLILAFGFMGIASFIYAEDAIRDGGMITMMITMIIIAFILIVMIGAMNGNDNEKIEMEEKALEKFREDLKSLAMEKQRIQGQLPAFPSSLIEELDIPGEKK